MTISLAAVVFLYALSWHVAPRQASDEIEGCDGLPWLLLMLAAYTGPALMLVMAGAGLVGDKRVSSLEEKLRKEAERKKGEQSSEMTKSVDTLEALLKRRTSR